MDKYQIKISTRQQNVDSTHLIGPAAAVRDFFDYFPVTPNRRGAALHARVTGRAWTERSRHSPGDVNGRAGHRAEGTAHPIRRFQTRRVSEHPSQTPVPPPFRLFGVKSSSLAMVAERRATRSNVGSKPTGKAVEVEPLSPKNKQVPSKLAKPAAPPKATNPQANSPSHSPKATDTKVSKRPAPTFVPVKEEADDLLEHDLGPIPEDDDEGEDSEGKRERRMISNRESARRSRQRKQARLADLSEATRALWADRCQALDNVRAMTTLLLKARDEHAQLTREFAAMGRYALEMIPEGPAILEELGVNAKIEQARAEAARQMLEHARTMSRSPSPMLAAGCSDTTAMTTAHVNAQLLHGDVDPYLETHAKITCPAA